MKITKEMREEAIEDCLVRADYWSAHKRFSSEELGTSNLAIQSFEVIPHRWDIDNLFDRLSILWLEAAALLRDGWSPGELVMRLEVSP